MGKRRISEDGKIMRCAQLFKCQIEAERWLFIADQVLLSIIQL